MTNWERQEIAKELKKELASAKRSHKRYEKKIAKRHEDELGYIIHRLDGVSETLLKSDCKVADDARKILEHLMTIIPATIKDLQWDKETTVTGQSLSFQHDLENQIKELIDLEKKEFLTGSK